VSAPRVIGVDLGGTKILSGLVERDGTVSAPRERVTPATSQGSSGFTVAMATPSFAASAITSVR